MNKKGLYLHYCHVTAANKNSVGIFTSKVDISYTLSINLDCVLAPSIDMVNTKSISPRPSEVLCFVGLEHCCPLSATMWICNLDFTCFASQSLIWSFSCNRIWVIGKDFKPDWISMAFIPNLPLWSCPAGHHHNKTHNFTYHLILAASEPCCRCWLSHALTTSRVKVNVQSGYKICIPLNLSLCL